MDEIKPQKDDNKGVNSGPYKKGDKVEILFVNGRWQSARVILDGRYCSEHPCVTVMTEPPFFEDGYVGSQHNGVILSSVRFPRPENS